MDKFHIRHLMLHEFQRHNNAINTVYPHLILQKGNGKFVREGKDCQ